MENIIWTLVEIIFSILFTAITYLFMQAFLQRKRKLFIVIKISILLGACILTNLVSTFFSDNSIIMICTSVLIAFFIGFAFFQAKIYIIIISAFFSTVAGAMSEIFAAQLVTGTQNVVVNEVTQLTVFRLQGRTLTILFMLIIVLFVSRFRQGKVGLMTTRLMLVLCAMPAISVYITLMLAINIMSSSVSPSVNEIISTISIAFVNVFFFALIELFVRQNENKQKLVLIEAQNEAYKKYIMLLTENQNQLRVMSHDFKQSVHELYLLCKEQNIEVLQNKLLELTGRESANLLVDTGNLMLDSILTAKFETIKSRNIELQYVFKIAPRLDYINTEICVLLGNALDNAIEACAKSDNNKFIGLELSATQEQLLCHIINSIKVAPIVDGGILQTSKADKLRHGIGYQSMSRICHDLGGSISYAFDEKNFNLWIEITFSM